MSELQEHEVSVENKKGESIIVSKAYYEQNKDKLKMSKGAAKNKMDKAPLENK